MFYKKAVLKKFAISTGKEYCLKSGPEIWGPGTLDPRPDTLGTWDPGLGTLGHMTLKPGTLEMRLLDPETRS